MINPEGNHTGMAPRLVQQCVQYIVKTLPEILAVYVFGSVSSGQMHVNSDLDLAVYTKSGLDRVDLWHASQKLASIVGRDVDLVDLNTATSVMRMQVVSRGERLFCMNEMLCEQFEDMIFSDYARLNEERSGILADIRQRGAVYG